MLYKTITSKACKINVTSMARHERVWTFRAQCQRVAKIFDKKLSEMKMLKNIFAWQWNQKKPFVNTTFHGVCTIIMYKCKETITPTKPKRKK